MNRQTAKTAKPLPFAARKAALAAMVSAGKITAAQADLVDLRDPTAKEQSQAEKLLPMARRVRGRQKAA